jgi:hypothetical protein
MIEPEVFYQLALHFKVYSIITENDIEILRESYTDKLKLRENIKGFIASEEKKLKETTKIEIFCLLSEFCFKNNISNIEICALFSIFWDTLRLSFYRYNKYEIFQFFKEKIIKHSMNRPPKQIGIFEKSTIEKISDFFLDVIYKKYEFLKYMLTKKKNIDIINKDFNLRTLPEILNLDLGTEIIPRNAKILKQYTENKKPKTQFEQNIETVIDFHRDILDKQLDQRFMLQDQQFHKKLEELLKKKR